MATALFGIALLSACSSTAPVLDLPGARSMVAKPPAPFRIAIAAPSATAQATADLESGSAIPFTIPLPALHESLAADLRLLATATEVITIERFDTEGAGQAAGTPDVDAAFSAQADLLLRPRLTSVQLAHLGGTSQGLLSSLLWFTTWAGGLFVPDNEYQAAIAVEWEVVNPHDGRTLDVLATHSGRQTLSFADRNDALSLSTLQSLVVPPVWTSDDAASTAATLSRSAVAQVAFEVARYVKSGMDGGERQMVGELRIDSPANGAHTEAAVTHLSGRVIAPQPIDSLGVYCGRTRIVNLDTDSLPTRAQQEMGALFQVPVTDLEVPLEPGPNLIRVVLGIAGHTTTRTLLVHRSAGGAAR